MKNKKYIKGFLEDIVLQLVDEHGEMYGYQITKMVQEATNGSIKITEGALYPILHKLENDGKLAVVFRSTNGRMRKYYSLTQEGSKAFETNLQELEIFLNGMKSLFKLKPTNG